LPHLSHDVNSDVAARGAVGPDKTIEKLYTRGIAWMLELLFSYSDANNCCNTQ
jgi:hypothetical protein